MPNEIDSLPRVAVPPWHLAVIAPPGFSPDVDALARAVWRLTRERRRTRPVHYLAVMGEPVMRALELVEPGRGGAYLHPLGALPRWAGSREVRRVSAHLASRADGVMVVCPGEPPRDLRWVAEVLCPWLGTPARVARVPGDG